MFKQGWKMYKYFSIFTSTNANKNEKQYKKSFFGFIEKLLWVPKELFSTVGYFLQQIYNGNFTCGVLSVEYFLR